MKQMLFLTPTCKGVSLYTISLGFVKAIEDEGNKVSFITPFSHSKEKEERIDEESFLNAFKSPLPSYLVEKLLRNNEEDKILDYVLGYIQKHTKNADLIVVEGAPHKDEYSYASHLNNALACALSAKIILVTTEGLHSPESLSSHLAMFADKLPKKDILGYILNKVGAPTDPYGNTRIDLFDPPKKSSLTKKSLKHAPFPLLGYIPWKRELMGVDIDGITKHLDGEVLNAKSYKNKTILHFILAAATLKFVSPTFNDGVMIITSGDRTDLIMAACMAFLNGTELAGMVLTGGHRPNKATLDLCKKAMDKGFPILIVQTDSLRTSIALQNIKEAITDKKGRLKKSKEYIAANLETSWLKTLEKKKKNPTMSPAAFRFHLIEKAKGAKKTIVLPEGNDIRILQAANFCSNKKVAKIIVLGNEKAVHALCKKNGCSLEKNITILNPETLIKKYLSPLLELRKHKGLTKEGAEKYLQDPIVIGMMMLHNNEVDGLVAGAVTSTAKVISPALKILKTAKGANLVSSIFFMCLEEEVLVYGDCAVNPNPSAEALADIAIQSAHSAKQFDIDPKVAMISYSTGSSGSGVDVEKVRKATEIIREKEKGIIVDGPLQYDAAKSPSIAKIKAPDSNVAGRATVFIFPDLNTANTTYKAVQQAAGVLSIGPVLQGLSKPVNDLSRGATVDDIIYTIAITAIQ